MLLSPKVNDFSAMRPH